MSDTPIRDPIDLQAILAELDRARAETRKLQQESDKFVAEQRKLMAEADKLRAEERKLGRDRFLAPWLAIAGLLGGVATIAITIARAVHLVP